MNRPAVGWLALVTVLFVASPALPQAGAQSTPRKIDVGGLKLRAQIEGHPSPKCPGLRAEAEVAILQLPKTGFEDFRSLPPLPDVPDGLFVMTTRSGH